MLVILFFPLLLAQDQEVEDPEDLSLSVVGYIRWSPSSPPPREILVQLMHQGGGLVRAQTLVGSASFEFSDVHTGEYLVSAESSGYEADERSIEVRTSSGSDIVSVQLLLESAVDEENARNAGEKTISVERLAIPKKAFEELEKAQRASGQGRSERAVSHYRKALGLYPRFLQAGSGLSVELLRLGRTREAAEVLQQSILLEPGEAGLYRNLAQVRIALGEFDSAVELIEESLRIEPAGTQGTWVILAEALMGMGRCDEGLFYLEKAVLLNAEHQSHLAAAECFLQAEKPGEALV